MSSSGFLPWTHRRSQGGTQTPGLLGPPFQQILNHMCNYTYIHSFSFSMQSFAFFASIQYMCNMCPFALTLYTIYYSVTRHAAKTLGKENIIKTSYKDYSIRAKFRNCRRKNILLSRRILSIFTKELSSSCTSI